MLQISEFCWLVLVAVLWGATNPFLKRGGQGITRVKQSNAVLQLLAELKFLISNWRLQRNGKFCKFSSFTESNVMYKYVLPFLLNQSGSLLYYFTLASVDLSIAVPVSNSLTFIFTGISGWVLGEEAINKTLSAPVDICTFRTWLGILLVSSGVALCVYSKL